MAERPCRLRSRGYLLGMLLMSWTMASHAVGIAAPQVMSGFNEPLRARVALLDTGTLRADDIRVTLADSARWQAMNVTRTADTDTLRLAVDGTPGHLYLDLRGSRALDTPWLDVVLTLRWPEGELTPQLTLLPTAEASGAGEVPTAGKPAYGPVARTRVPASSNLRRDPEADRQATSSESSARDDQRLSALEEKIDRLEQQLRASLDAQTALATDLASLRALSLNAAPVNDRPDDTAELAALTQRQQALESRLDQLDQQVLAADTVASQVPRAETVPSAVSSQTAAHMLDNGAGRHTSFVWTWVLAAVLLILAGAWAGVRRWRQRRYRLVSAQELSSTPGATAPFEGTAAADGGEDDAPERSDLHEYDEAWSAHRAQVEAICAEAEVFQRHGRREHAITMLREGLAQYPGDAQLIQALAALEAMSERQDACDSADDDQARQGASMPSSDPSPTLAPAWTLSSFPDRDAPSDAIEWDMSDPRSGNRVNLPATPGAVFPQGWALEEVAFEGGDTDNERPDADSPHRHR
ncbi:hypothetical protein C8D96_0434 [Kushneria marisflavi]|uniref:FimV N-terminal domain-containing protein n=2 Tax=Kushneria marisflavi TaxID=157779 RepID=A0A240ULL7_9GAMM|nr:hypothetical protein B9H00_01650 [Kushneria marisflavi]RKD86979.1 hypothetical protein C8D96_0434 [Kushneria marisflavi]